MNEQEKCKKIIIPEAHFPDVLTCLTLGAGLVLLEDMDKAKQVQYSLEETIRDPSAGAWESEIAKLVQRQDWMTLHVIAEQLRHQ